MNNAGQDRLTHAAINFYASAFYIAHSAFAGQQRPEDPCLAMLRALAAEGTGQRC